MEIEIIQQLVNNMGVPIALVVYFVWKDYKKDDQTNKAINNNTTAVRDLTTIVKERIPKNQRSE